MTRIDYKKRLEEALNKIEWKLKHCGCEHYSIVNHKDETTEWGFYDNTIDNRNNGCGANAYFNLKYSRINILDNDCVSVGNKHLFILFMNHDK